MDIISKIEKHAGELIGIRVNGVYYNVNCISTNHANEFVTLYAYQLDDDNCYIEYEFSYDDIVNSDVKIYRLEEI